MNLYIETLANYIGDEWNRALAASEGAKEARFIIQSLDPDSVFALFQDLDNRRLKWLQNNNQTIKCYFRVATPLWQDWCSDPGAEEQLNKKMASLGALGPDGERLWIDEEDQLTWYRNRTTSEEKCDGLVVVLVGLNHATDQGGLADFHRVDEARIWRKMERSFVSWITLVNERLDLHASHVECEQFDTVLQRLFQIRPMRLGRLAQFLEQKIIDKGDFYSFGEFTERLFMELPFWGIPPLAGGANAAALRGTKGATALVEAEAFISHKRYKTASGRKKDWTKIASAIEEPEFEIPRKMDGSVAFLDVEDYGNKLKSFIEEADAEARALFLQTDLMPLLKILQRKEQGKRTSQKVPVIKGLSFEVLLQGIWLSLEGFEADCGGQPLAKTISGIHVELVRFDHDLSANDDGGIGANDLAHSLLLGCLGGLDTVVENMDCKIPRDQDQAQLPREQWDLELPITLNLALAEIDFGISRARPNIQFKVTISSYDPGLTKQTIFKWVFDATQPERVLHECSRLVIERWAETPNPERLLPAFRIPSVAMAALYFATDADEANRLVSQAVTDLELINLLEGLTSEQMDPLLWEQTTSLISDYRAWLQSTVAKGYYTARAEQMPKLLSSFLSLAEKVLSSDLLGSAELLRRFYKAFLVVDEAVEANDPSLPGAIVWGLSPAVLELSQARVGFLADGFPEAIGEMAIGGDGKAAFARLLDLARIRRPLAAMVTSSQQLSAEIKSFGLLHYLGPEPATGNSLAVQTLLRDDASDDDEDVRDIVRPCEERDMVARVLSDYQQLYSYAEDGLRVLAVNVRELETILSGVDFFLENYLKRTPADWPSFHCSVMVYSTSSSPMAVENKLALWRNHVMENQRGNGRGLELIVGHRYAKREQIVDLLKREKRLYDIAFVFHFLRSGLSGEADAAKPFEFDFSGWDGLQFPITEYPRPIKAGDQYRRQSLLSNRRMRTQTRHSDLSARLRYGGTGNNDHVIFGQVDFKPWSAVVESLHEHAHWVACIDPFVDKHLMSSGGENDQRKIVGFASGLGGYGELNLSISTEQDTLKQLAGHVSNRLTELLPFEETADFESMSVRVVREAEEVIGLSSLRAVVGADERIREVLGFAAIRRALAVPKGRVSQLLPLDSLRHWFAGKGVTLRPDLLQLTLEVRPDDIPLIHAVLVECKFAKKDQGHLAKAIDQIQDGLQHLVNLLAPKKSKLRVLGFDRRYWWAQIHRAVATRSVVECADNEWKELDHALESLAEGQFEIHWQAAIFTFWTDEKGPSPKVSMLKLSKDVIQSPIEVPDNFGIQHIELGYRGVSSLFAKTETHPLVEMNGVTIKLRPDFGPARTSAEMPVSVDSSPTGPSTNEQKPQAVMEGGKKPGSVKSTNPPSDFLGEEMVDPSLEQIPDIVTEKVDLHLTQPDPPYPHGGTTVPLDADADSETSAVVSIPPETAFQVPEKIFLGTRGNGEQVYWHFGHPQLANRHLLIFGASGSGKTYGIQCLLAEMACQKLRSLIVDYTDGFLPQQVEPRFIEAVRPANHFVVTDQLPLNPFRRQQVIIDPSIPAIEESSYQVATRIESIFSSIFELGAQQSAALIRVVQAGVENDPNFTLEGVLIGLQADSKYGETLGSKLEPLIRSEPFSESDQAAWGGMLESVGNWVHVLQLKGMARDIQKMVTEFALWDLWDYVQNTGSKNRPIPIILDEIQNLDHNSDSPIDKMLREGRKFGLSLILATQTTSQFNQEQRDRLFQAGHKLFFKPATTEIDRFSQILSQSTIGVTKAEWAKRLTVLEKGQCWSLGPVLRSNGTFSEEAVLVNVTSLEDRQFGSK
jgi:DNA phosphorothioation-dependent restriction protein DptH